MGAGRSGPEPHVHEDEDDAFLVLDDEMTFLLADEELTAPAGTFVLVPPGVEHTFVNRAGQPVRMLNIHAPAGFDRRLMS
jgi:mannose-6-phosphate isomerase-like protein (cupin superfamily)